MAASRHVFRMSEGKIREIATASAPRPIGAFSQAIAGDSLLFASGQGPVDPVNGEIGETIEEQTARTLRNLEAVLAAGGASLDDVVSCRVYLADLDQFAQYDAVYARFFPNHKPARTTIGAELLGGIMIEIELIAHVEDRSKA